ncbi:MAG TPA: LysR family transcriptional regulator, partial [Polyangiaceae bacterium]|nr:LysR family transcriptional regulator [Polyangiaceae bacterium]
MATTPSVPLPWDDVKIFLAVAREGSIAAAGKALALDHATVSRRLAAFEKTMGQKAFTRGRSGVRLTHEGEALLAIAQRAEEPMLALQSRRASASAETGTVRLATAGILSAWLLPRHIVDLQRSDPLVRLELTMGRRLVDLSKREADLALRIRPSGSTVAEPSTLVRKLADVGFALYGTREALRARERRVVRFSSLEPGASRLDAEGRGAAPSVVVDDMPTALMVACAGCGLSVLPCFMADAEP